MFGNQRHFGGVDSRRIHQPWDIQHDIGLSIPLRSWSLDVDEFHTSARNFLDHDVIGNSGIFIPLSDLGAVISGTEVTIRSPRLFNRMQWRAAYSNQMGQ